MMFRSIRASLTFWVAVILLGSIAVLLVVLHRELRATLYRECDLQLGHWAATVTANLAAPEGSSSLPAALPDFAHFAVFGVGGPALQMSGAMPQSARPTREGTATVDHHRWRTVARPGDQGWIVVGRSVRDENHSIRQFLTTLLVTGTGIVLLTCAGGFVVASRVLAPTKVIAATAQRIATAQLSERIDVERVPSELRPMAVTLNESFARIEDAFATQAAFTADASHELRTPLAVIVAHLELATMRIGDPKDVGERLRICQDAALRIERIVKGLLTLARTDSGGSDGGTAAPDDPVDLGPLVVGHVEAMTPLASARDVAIVANVETAFVRGNQDQLGEVVLNLIDNAIRYNQPNGTVTVTVVCEQQSAVLRVADSGVGLTEEQMRKVFDRFYRADASRSRSDGASGLGLAITRSIVEQHGGSIAVRSRGSGSGCEFVVRLPQP